MVCAGILNIVLSQSFGANEEEIQIMKKNVIIKSFIHIFGRSRDLSGFQLEPACLLAHAPEPYIVDSSEIGNVVVDN